jgi:hypothetical protein
LYHDFETHYDTYADVDGTSPGEMAEWQVEVLNHSQAASTEFSTMSFPPNAMKRINETEGRYVLKDAVRYPGSEAMAFIT